MNIDDIINEHFSNSSQSKKDDFRRWATKFVELCGSTPLSSVQSDTKLLCKTFYLSDKSAVSRPSYQKVKEYLTVVLGQDAIIPTREQVLESQEKTLYYKNLQSVIDLIDSVGASKLDNYDKDDDLLFIKSLTILGWHGFSTDEAAALKKTALTYQDNKFYINSSTGGGIEITKADYTILDAAANNLAHRRFPDGRKEEYQDSEFLFRSYRADSDITTGNTLRQYLKRFNSHMADTGYAISFSALKRNSLFVRVHDDNSTQTTHQKIMHYAPCNSVVAYGYEAEYNRWKSLYHKN